MNLKDIRLIFKRETNFGLQGEYYQLAMIKNDFLNSKFDILQKQKKLINNSQVERN